MRVHLCGLYPREEGFGDQGLKSRRGPVEAHVPIAPSSGILFVALIDDVGNSSLWLYVSL